MKDRIRSNGTTVAIRFRTNRALVRTKRGVVGS